LADEAEEMRAGGISLCGSCALVPKCAALVIISVSPMIALGGASSG
jgi:hypothetical protein